MQGVISSFFFAVALFSAPLSFAKPPQAKLDWQPWSAELFAKAKQENKLVILDLEAVWCHWCHVMEEETYANPEVARLLTEKFLLIRVDQDSRPDLSKRYADYGWPATIFFDGSGRELAKRAGFVPPEKMVGLLKKLIKKPIPEEAVAEEKTEIPESPFLTKALRERMNKRHLAQYEGKTGGWGSVHKFLFGPSEELALLEGLRGNKASGQKGLVALTKNIKIIDPVWGGVYQYSVDGWDEAHFEKIAWAQHKNLVLYSYGYSITQDPKFLVAANDIKNFLTGFLLTPDGAFYTSMDADLVKGTHSEDFFKLDDQGRRAKGIPSIDKNIYSRENGWYIQGLAALYAVSGQDVDLKLAENAASWILKNRAREDGGFTHGEKDVAGPYLGDNLEMAQALLSLYEVTGDRKWLTPAEKAAQFLAKEFSVTVNGKPFGFKTSASALLPGQKPDLDRMENIRIARFGARLFQYTGVDAHKKMAEQAMRYLVQPTLATTMPTAGTLLADEELTRPPLHLTIVGAKGAGSAKALFQAGLAYPANYRRIEWWDKKEGELPRKDVTYPDLSKPALFVCTEGRCSLPMFDPKLVRAKIDDLLKAKPAKG